MTSFSIAIGPANAVRDTMTNINTTMKGRLEDLETTAEKTLHAWEGDAQTRYWECKARWNQAAEATNAAYGSAAAALDNIIYGYLMGDKKAGGFWPSGGSS